MESLLYGCATLCYGIALFKRSRVVVALALLTHALALFGPLVGAFIGNFPAASPRFGFAYLLSATIWVGALILWFEDFAVKIQSLWRFVLPLAVALTWLPVVFPGAALVSPAERPLFMPHVVSGLFAYGVMLLAALLAVTMMFAERALHSGLHRTNTPAYVSSMVETLPPLLVLERLLFKMLGVGFLLLTLTVLTGVVFSEATFGKPMKFDHKNVFAMIAWAVFGVLLLGRRLRGWRGRTALRFTLIGFGLMMLAYVGSRFILEVVLGRI
jgi:ABC-type uncharacterized transport system permease subunit